MGGWLPSKLRTISTPFWWSSLNKLMRPPISLVVRRWGRFFWLIYRVFAFPGQGHKKKQYNNKEEVCVNNNGYKKECCCLLFVGGWEGHHTGEKKKRAVRGSRHTRWPGQQTHTYTQTDRLIVDSSRVRRGNNERAKPQRGGAVGFAVSHWLRGQPMARLVHQHLRGRLRALILKFQELKTLINN